MKLVDAKTKFIHAWGTLGTNWGISRTMAQVHALLMVAPSPLSTEDIMEELRISRGNANMTLRELIDWGLARREIKQGERREYFVGEKDIHETAKCIARERQKRELEPLLKVLDSIDDLDERSAEAKQFTATIKGIHKFAQNVDGVLNKMVKADENWFFGFFTKLLK
jgi:DNA-binding transcriptional regulator GbsR (MarR family)